MKWFPFCLCLNWEHRLDHFLSGTSWTETTKVSAVDSFEMGEFFLFSTDIPVQILLAEETPCSPVNTQGSRTYVRAKGQEWLRQYVIWLSSPGNWSLEKDTQFSLPWSGAGPASRVDRCYWHSDKPPQLLQTALETWMHSVLHLCNSATLLRLGYLVCTFKTARKDNCNNCVQTAVGWGCEGKAAEAWRIINFSHGVWLGMWSFGQENTWGSAVSNTSPRGCHNHALDTESQMFTQSSSHTLVSKNYTEMGSARLISWMALSDSRHPVYKFSPYIFLQFKLQCLINWFDWRERTK